MHTAETGSLSYGLFLRLRLLSTPPRGDAVTLRLHVYDTYIGGLSPPDKATLQTHIGVGKSLRPPLPPNRTCGFPAYGSPVGGLSSSGRSRVEPSYVKSEQPGFREKGLWPLSMVCEASSKTGALVLLTQDGAQPPPGHTVEFFRMHGDGHA